MKIKNWQPFLITFILIVMFEFFGYVALKLQDQKDPLKSLFPKRYQRLRAVLAKEEGFLPRYISAININFMPTPNYSLFGMEQHNSDGYRGDKINLEKTDKIRILFLGGSTTYGSGVANPKHTFPSYTSQILNSLLKEDGLNLEVEVINAGLEGGRSSDELNNYIHKFRYYRPDIVVIHSAGNDAEIDILSDNYTPDLINIHSPEMYQMYRNYYPSFIFKSYLISYLIIRLHLHDHFNHDQPRGKPKVEITANWFDNTFKEDIVSDNYKNSPFANNMKALTSIAIKDSAKIIFIPFAINKNDEYSQKKYKYIETIKAYNEIKKSMCDYEKVFFWDYKYETVTDKYWIDDCHLTKEGEYEKAYSFSIFIIDSLLENYYINK